MAGAFVFAGTSMRSPRSDFPELEQRFWRGHLWSPSYFAGSCGGAPISVLHSYIEQQRSPAARWPGLRPGAPIHPGRKRPGFFGAVTVTCRDSLSATSIDVAAMSDSDHENLENIVDHSVQDAITAGPDTQDIFAAAQLPRTRRPRIIRQRVDLAGDLSLDRAIQLCKFAFGRTQETYGVRHRQS